jgi:hypothetical protein
MPELLYEGTGLRIVRNDLNKFIVATLHYTADPKKRTKEWKAEASAGMRPARWAKEYELDYTALYGQRVFPEFAIARDRIVVPPPHREFSALQVFWGGFDFGQRNPSAFVVYTIDEGVIHAVWEHYEPCRNINDLAAKITGCPYYSQIKYIACDPTIVNRKTQINKYGTMVTIAELLGEVGLKKLIPGVTDEAAWIELMRKHWADSADPTFRIWSCCPNLIKEFENAVFQEQSDREMLTQTYSEGMEDVHNHAMDATKYFMLSRPRVAARAAYTQPMARWWLK